MDKHGREVVRERRDDDKRRRMYDRDDDHAPKVYERKISSPQVDDMFGGDEESDVRSRLGV